MNKPRSFKWLLLANAVLAAWLAWGVYNRKHVSNTFAESGPELPGAAMGKPGARQETRAENYAAATPFAEVYSTDPKKFADNLRAIGCPDQTVRYIITAKV